jgi:hypothetical protein
MPINEREVDPLRLALDELVLQRLLGSWVLGKDHQPGCVSIDPVNDERSSALRPKVSLEMTVDGRLSLLARERDRQQPCRFVQHQQVTVFVNDVEP